MEKRRCGCALRSEMELPFRVHLVCCVWLGAGIWSQQICLYRAVPLHAKGDMGAQVVLCLIEGPDLPGGVSQRFIDFGELDVAFAQVMLTLPFRLAVEQIIAEQTICCFFQQGDGVFMPPCLKEVYCQLVE